MIPWYWQAWFSFYLARISVCMLTGCLCTNRLPVLLRMTLIVIMIRRLVERTV